MENWVVMIEAPYRLHSVEGFPSQEAAREFGRRLLAAEWETHGGNRRVIIDASTPVHSFSVIRKDAATAALPAEA